MDELLCYFSDVTGVDNERARFHLDAADWDLQVALANFYECVESSPALDELATAAAAAAAAVDTDAAAASKEKKSDEAEVAREKVMSADVASKGETSARSSSAKSRRAEPKPRRNIATLDQLQNKDGSSDEEGQAFYAGGSEHSGQQVLGPSKKNDIVNDMFKSCQGQAIASSDDRPSSQRRNRPNTFGGTGYKLGQTSSDATVDAEGSSLSQGGSSESSTVASADTVGGTTTSATAQATSTRNNPGHAVMMLKLWRDGFTVNDREIRLYSEPENREFLAAIKRGLIPPEIREEVQGAEVRLDMEDHRHEEYVPPKARVKAFTGRGHKLGSPSPATVGMTVPTDPADQAANESQARSQLNVDSSRPVTSIQIRLADGTSIRQQFNTSHTVGDVRRFITTMRPRYALQEFSLLTSYPSRELSQEDETIEQAGLHNSAIMQRLK